MTELQDLTGTDVLLRSRKLFYPASQRRPWPDSVSTVRGGELYRLAARVEDFAKAGFARADVTWWVLCGVRPQIPRYRITFHKNSRRAWGTLELNAQNISEREIEQVCKTLKSFDIPSLKRTRPPSSVAQACLGDFPGFGQTSSRRVSCALGGHPYPAARRGI